MSTQNEQEIVNEESKVEETKAISKAEIDKIAKNTGKALKKEKQVEIKIPKDPLNKNDEYVPVCINGYIYQIKRGEKVEVPEAVRDILEEAEYI